jgi:hypothetical protein
VQFSSTQLLWAVVNVGVVNVGVNVCLLGGCSRSLGSPALPGRVRSAFFQHVQLQRVEDVWMTDPLPFQQRLQIFITVQGSQKPVHIPSGLPMQLACLWLAPPCIHKNARMKNLTARFHTLTATALPLVSEGGSDPLAFHCPSSAAEKCSQSHGCHAGATMRRCSAIAKDSVHLGDGMSPASWSC